MTNQREFNGGGAALTAPCASCRKAVHNEVRKSDAPALPLGSRRRPDHRERYAAFAALARHDLAADHRLLHPGGGQLAPGRKHRRQLDSHADIGGAGIARARYQLAICYCSWRAKQRLCNWHISWQQRIPSHAGLRRRPTHGHHQQIPGRLHLEAHRLSPWKGVVA